MKTILIPTDFTIESLNIVKGALAKCEGQRLSLVLICGAELSTSITDLLFFSRSRLLASLQNEKFTEACEILKNKYGSQLHQLRIELFTGHTQRAFDLFIEGQKAQELYVPRTYRFRPGRGSFDILSFCRASRLPIHEIEWRETVAVPEKDRVAELFLVPGSL